MKESIVSYLVCPNKIKGKACRKGLVLKEVFRHFKSAPEEIKEGFLECRVCGSRFPIFLEFLS